MMIAGLNIQRRDTIKSTTATTQRMSKWDDAVQEADAVKEDIEKDQVVDQVGRQVVADLEVVQRVGVKKEGAKGD